VVGEGGVVEVVGDGVVLDGGGAPALVGGVD
jgi:hypothetical protein